VGCKWVIGGGGSPTHPVRPGLRLRAGSFIPAMARYFGATGGSTSSNEGVEWSESARWVLENTELLWAPFQEPQEDGSVGFGRIHKYPAEAPKIRFRQYISDRPTSKHMRISLAFRTGCSQSVVMHTYT